MKQKYKIAIIGLGSIGTRHLVNIIKVLQSREYNYTIDVIRSNKGQVFNEDIKKKINNTYYSFEEVPDNYDVIFVTNPTNLHYDTIKQFAPKTRHMFIEKPVFDKVNLSLEDLPLNKNSVYYVACPLRYTGVLQFLKQNCDVDKVYCARVICSSYLPNWRPDVDYRKTYSANKDQGGGVSIDLIHEWDYICYLFGKPQKLYNIRGKFSDLDIDSDDLSLYLAKYKNMAVELHLDYFGRKSIREIQLFMDKDTIVGDLINSEVRYLTSGRIEKIRETRNDYQIREIEYFFDILEGKQVNHNDILTALTTLQIAKEGILS